MMYTEYGYAYFHHYKGEKIPCTRKTAIQLLSEYYYKLVPITDDIGMSICDYDKAEKELKNIQAQLRRNPHRVIIVGNLEVRKEKGEA